MKVRFPSQAGAFYARSKETLKKQVEDCFLHRFGPKEIPSVNENGPRKIVSLMCPHAGYAYSGPVAANAYFQMAKDGKIDSAIILGPNHTGIGSGISIMTEGVWRMPLNDVEIDFELARKIQHASKYIDVDDTAHSREHSIEVQLPFLQYIYGKSFRFVPICMMMQDLESSRDVGEAIVESISGRNVITIASTDLTHYESEKVANSKDRMAINTVLELDDEKLQSVVESSNITMCGYGPASVAIYVAKKLGAEKTSLLSYKTSGDITGDFSSVVGYAAIAIAKE